MLFQLAAAAAPKTFWVKGQMIPFIFLMVVLAFVYFFISRAKAGMPVPPIRKINGLEAIDEAVGRATEMGRPVHTTSGLGFVHTPSTFAFWAILAHVAKLCAKYDTRLINTNYDYQVLTVNEEIIKQSYLEAGRPDAFNADDVRYLSGWQFTYTAACLGIFQREKIAANIMIGHFMAEAMLLAEGAHNAGAVQIAGTLSTFQLPWFITACDYTLVGEEIFAAGAYVSREPVLVGSVIGQDMVRILIFVLILIGTILQNVTAKNVLAEFMKR